MDPGLTEILKIGGPVLLFAVVLLYATLKDKDRMATEMNSDKKLILEAFRENTKASVELKNAFAGLACVRQRERDNASNGG